MNTYTGKLYIGSAVNLRHRWHCHKHDLESGKHCSKRLLRAWNKYGRDSFQFMILDQCEKEELIVLEQRMIDLVRPYIKEVGYNNLPFAGNVLGLKHSDETKQKMRLAKLGKKGRHISEEERINKRLSHLGKKLGPQTREWIEKRTAGMRGKRRSPEVIEKIRNGLIGKMKGVPWTQARRDAQVNRIKKFNYDLPFGESKCV